MKKSAWGRSKAPWLVTALLLASVGPQVAAQNEPITLNFYSEGDVNVQDLWQKTLIPMYQKAHPNIKINLVFSAHGTSSQSTLDRMAGAQKANKPSGVDLLEGNVPDAGEAGLLEKLDTRKVPLLSRVEPNTLARAQSYGVPYRGSSVVLAYDSNRVKNPPQTLDALIAWINKNPGQFTYNAPDSGGSGNAFVTRILRLGIDPASSSFFETDYDASKEKQWDKGFALLKQLAPNLYNGGQYSKNNVETLQLLGKGAIAMGPVWSDQALSYMKQGLLPPNIKLVQIRPAFYGGSSYVGVSKDSQNKQAAYDFLNWLLSSDVQAIVADQMNGYPGVRLQYMPKEVQTKYGSIAKDFSFNFSSKFNSDMNRLWYERIAGRQ
ncbi:extracellular solute-binding protein (plasmid) [Deinococcus metallilatus]|uniref:Extracellular solute-binding protein n=1 Tax=Deinococcus metallilatus TaxID=1211322 RepID=A0AAJ5F874_9DEIO|nr:extracellular solute-binding protein [Deinococcus metallilatus]MBB5295688.1 putative spermidine/putrescine transport system substrate-binding protein [Deinococcus metallilatus]QBY06859.1 extracellular solute-binding protein [Deinococcus metallilatus]TLK32248.1 extracellular solute-binding protein [Deinococcus metallilatus]GMA14218.1 ABC transporter substrate-binding protein [Deinococcus metallilatus]